MSKKDEYKYSNLSTLSDKIKDPIHFYGTIVDASFPYKTAQRHVVSCKVVDASLAKKGNVADKDFVTVVFYGKTFDDLPIMQRVGDIIRVHRAEFENHNDRKQLNVNMFFRSSWCLFIGNEKDKPNEPKVVNEEKTANFFRDTPYNFSGRSFTWGDEDVALIKNLRKWTKDYFGKNFVHSATVKKSDVATAIKKKTDFDIQGKIVKIKANDTWTNIVYINDTNGTTWTANLYKKKFPGLANGDAIRVRSVTSNAQNVLTLSSHSNVLQFITGSKVRTTLSKIKGDITQAGKDIATITNKKQAKQDVTPLKALFFNPKKSTGTFHTQFKVVKTDPSKPADWTKGKGKKAKFSVKLVVSDYHNADDDKAYMVHCVDEKFFGKHKPDAAKKLLTTKGHFVSAVLERQGKNYSIVNTKLN